MCSQPIDLRGHRACAHQEGRLRLLRQCVREASCRSFATMAVIAQQQQQPHSQPTHSSTRHTFNRCCSTARTCATQSQLSEALGLASRVSRHRPWKISSTLSFPPAYRWTKCSRSRTATTTAARPSVSVPEASACACECCVCANRHNENEDKACLEKAQRVDCNLRRKAYVN